MLVMESPGRLGKILVGMGRALGESESYLDPKCLCLIRLSSVDRQIRMSKGEGCTVVLAEGITSVLVWRITSQTHISSYLALLQNGAQVR